MARQKSQKPKWYDLTIAFGPTKIFSPFGSEKFCNLNFSNFSLYSTSIITKIGSLNQVCYWVGIIIVISYH